MQRKRSLWIIVVTLAAVLSAFFISGTLDAPESSSKFDDGQFVTVQGNVTCLPHKNQDGPQTMECAFGFKDTDGNYYGLIGGESLMTTPQEETITINGVYKAETSEKYQQNGVIEIAEGEFIVD